MPLIHGIGGDVSHSESDQQSEIQEDDTPKSNMLITEVPEFKPAEPKKYMTAADFERVCNQLQTMSNSYEQSAKRYEKAIETTEKTIKTCQRAEQKIDRFCRINEKMLNDGLVKIGKAMTKGLAAAESQQ